MDIVKSFAVGAGDMYYINHSSSNFTIIDCCLDYDDESKAAKSRILREIADQSRGKNIVRFISTHPDEDHISGLATLNEQSKIQNFYRVNNQVAKAGEESEDFKLYKVLRDNEDISFELALGCKRKWMNLSDASNGSANIECLWPAKENDLYKIALEEAKSVGKPNNISPVIRFTSGKFSFLWMGDMETDMQKELAEKVRIPETTVVFAPHHGRKSGHIPAKLMQMLNPMLIIVGEADSKDLDYYKQQHTITQNTAKDIAFCVEGNMLDIYVGNPNYSVTYPLYQRYYKPQVMLGMHYIGGICITDD